MKDSSKALRRHKRRGAFVLCIVDPLQGPNGPYSFYHDSSHLLLQVFQEKGYRVFLTDPSQLFLSHTGEYTFTRKAIVLDQEPYFQIQPPEQIPLTQFSLILMRKDPPIDLVYMTATQILEKVSHQVPVINDPQSLQRWNEKLVILNFPKYIPPTFASANKKALDHFIHSLKGDCILKPLNGFGGRGIQKINPADKNYLDILLEMTHEGKTPIVAQKFLREIFQGEKRVFMIDGKPMGALLKKPSQASFIANPDMGATVCGTHLTVKEKRLCQEVGSWLKKQKIFFAGLDLIGGKLTEINMTSPGLIWEWDQIDNKCYEEEIVSQIERKFL